MTVKELARHFEPLTKYKIREHRRSEIIEDGVIGEIQDSKEGYYQKQEVKDFTAYQKYLEIWV